MMITQKASLDMTHYGTLGVSIGAYQRDITTAYHKLARIHHPNKAGGSLDDSHSEFPRINQAYEVLGDPISREKYDGEMLHTCFKEQIDQQVVLWKQEWQQDKEADGQFWDWKAQEEELKKEMEQWKSNRLQSQEKILKKRLERQMADKKVVQVLCHLDSLKDEQRRQRLTLLEDMMDMSADVVKEFHSDVRHWQKGLVENQQDRLEKLERRQSEPSWANHWQGKQVLRERSLRQRANKKLLKLRGKYEKQRRWIANQKKNIDLLKGRVRDLEEKIVEQKERERTQEPREAAEVHDTLSEEGKLRCSQDETSLGVLKFGRKKNGEGCIRCLKYSRFCWQHVNQDPTHALREETLQPATEARFV